MEGLRETAFQIICVSLFCGILSGLMKHTAARDLLKMLCGLLVVLTLLRPFADIEFSAVQDLTGDFLRDGEKYSFEGLEMAQQMQSRVISQRCEAYIMDKAAQLNAELQATVAVTKDQRLESVRIVGRVSPYVRSRLEQIMETELGIPKENQQWSGA